MANTHSLDLESGSSQYAGIADASQTGLDLSTALTLECWVKPESLPSDGTTYFFMSKFATGNTNAAYQFRISNTGGTYTLFLAVVANPSADELGVTYALSTGAWTHLAVTWLGSSKTAKFYVNGAQQGSDQVGTLISSIDNCTADFQIGARNGTLNYDGLIDDVRVWNVVRTVTEINDNKALELVGNESGLVGYWKFNNAYTDSTSNANTLTSSGSPVFSTDKAFGAAYTQSVDEVVTIVASMSRAITKSLGEVVTIVDTMRKDISRAFGEVVTIVASSSANIAFLQSFSETLTVVDTITNKIVAKILYEALAVVDTMTTVSTFMRSLAETVTVVASSAIVRQYARAYNEAVSIVDTLANHVALTKTLNEALGIVERFQGLKNGVDIKWLTKYSAAVGTWIKKYLDF